MSAGPSVIETTIAVRTVTPRPGPNALSNCVLATASDAVVAATMMPAAKTIGEYSAVARRAARTRGAFGEMGTHPGEEEHRVIGGHPEQQHDEHGF